MTVFNMNYKLERGAVERVSSLFNVLEDDMPIKRAFQDFNFLASFVGSGMWNSQPQEVDIKGTGDTVRNGAFEAIRTIPRQMLMFNKSAIQEELLQSYVEGLEYQRFVGGIGDELGSSSIISPFLDGVINGNASGNVVIEENSFLIGYSKLHKVGTPYVVFNPAVDGASEAVKEFLDIFPNAIVSAPSWLNGTQHMQGIKGFVTTTGAMALGKFTDPEYYEDEHLDDNTVTVRLSSEIFGAEVFKRATAIIGTPVKPTKTALKKGIV